MKRDRFSDGTDRTLQEVRMALKFARPLFVICLVLILAGAVGVAYKSGVFDSQETPPPIVDGNEGNDIKTDDDDDNGPNPPRPNLPQWYHGIMKIEAGSGTGTGFLVKPNFVITNAHVVTGAPGGTVRLHFSNSFNGGGSIEGRVVWQGQANGKKEDIALIEVPAQDANLICPIGKSANVVQTEKVRVLGYPLSVEELTITDGTINSSRRAAQLFQTDAEVNMGNSGGPMVSLEQSAVVGVVVSEADHTTPDGRLITGTNFSIMIDYVMKQIGDQLR